MVLALVLERLDALRWTMLPASLGRKTLAKYVSDLTDTFNNRVSSVYSGMSGRVIGPMLLVESSAAVGKVSAKPAAMMNLYALYPGHTFDLGTFVDGKMPPQAEVALAQTLVSLT